MEFLHGRPLSPEELELIRLEIETLTASKRQVVHRNPSLPFGLKPMRE